MSAARTFEIGPSYRDHSTQVGFEATVFEVLALRYGNSTHYPGEISSWGAGLILDHGLLGRFAVQADLGGSDMSHGGPAALLVNPAPLGTGDRAALAFDRAEYPYPFSAHFNTYSGFAAQGHWHLGFAVEDFVPDTEDWRTSYNPEGDNRTYEMRDRMTLIGLSHSRESRLFGQSVRWSVGAAWRRFSSTVKQTDPDSTRQRGELQETCISMAASLSSRAEVRSA